MDPATGTPVAKLMRLPEQLYLTNSEFRDEDYDSKEFSSEFSRSFSSAAAATASHHAGHGGGGGGHHQAVVSSTGRCYYLSTKRSGGSLGEVLAAIPFKWEEAPGRPKVSRSRKSSRGSTGGGATDQFFDNCGLNQQFPPRPKPARTRPQLHSRRQSSVSFHLNARLQAEQLLATPPPGASSLEYNNKGAGAADLLIDPVLPLPPRLRLGTTRLITAAADSSQDQFQHRYDSFLGVAEPLPNGPRVDHRRTQSTMAFPTNHGHRRAWSLSYPAIEQPAEPRISKEAAISSGRVEDFESTRSSLAAAVGGDGSKDFWPSLKEKMGWRNAKLAGITLHRYLAKRFPQNGRGKNNNNNKGDDENDKNCNWPGYFHILESSPQHRSSRFSDKLEKKKVDHGGGGAARGGRGGLPISRGNRSAAPSSHFSTRSAYAAAPAISGRHNRYTTEFPTTGADRRFDRAITFPRTRKQRSSAVSSRRFSRAVSSSRFSRAVSSSRFSRAVSSSRFSRAVSSSRFSRAWLSSPVRCCYNFRGITSLGYESP